MKAISEFLDKWWSVGLVTFIGGLLSAAAIQVTANPALRTAAISLIAALVTTSVVKHVQASRDDIRRDLKLRADAIAAQIAAAALNNSLSQVRDPFFRNVATRMMMRIETGLRQLAAPYENSFANQGQYMDWATEHIRKLTAAGKVLAVCGDKDWDDDSVRAFNRENCAVAESPRTRVERIFLQFNASGFPTGEQEVLDEHLAAKRRGANIEPFVVRPRDAKRSAEDYFMSPGFGFTLLAGGPMEPVVLVHWGLAGDRRGGVRFTAPEIVREFERIHAELRQRAYPYDGVLRKT